MANSSGSNNNDDSDKSCVIFFSSRIVEANCIGCHGYLYRWNMADQLL